MINLCRVDIWLQHAQQYICHPRQYIILSWFFVKYIYYKFSQVIVCMFLSLKKPFPDKLYTLPAWFISFLHRYHVLRLCFIRYDTIYIENNN